MNQGSALSLPGADYASVLSEARIRDGVRAATMLWRAFDKTVRRKPLAFAVDAVYGEFNRFVLEIIARKGVARKAWLLIFVNVQVLAFTRSWYAAAVLLSSADMFAPTHAVASAAQVASF
jgi:hypothetical protein